MPTVATQCNRRASVEDVPHRQFIEHIAADEGPERRRQGTSLAFAFDRSEDL